MPFDPDAVRRWLDDIRYHIVLAQTFADGMSYEVFRDDLRTIIVYTRPPRKRRTPAVPAILTGPRTVTAMKDA
jgi:hypothetical protein